MRPNLKEGDYVMGISPAGVGEHRRVLLWLHIAKAMTFGEAYELGDKDRIFRAARGNAIHVRPKKGLRPQPGNPNTYEHIPHATHASDWKTDILGKRDAFFVGDELSWIAEDDAPEVTEELVELLRKGITWSGQATVQNPLTENARGKHVLLTGKEATRIIQSVRVPKKILASSRPIILCRRYCICE